MHMNDLERSFSLFREKNIEFIFAAASTALEKEMKNQSKRILKTIRKQRAIKK